MKFVPQPYQPGDTIAAIATPPGEGGVAIIRISGDHAFQVASQVFSGDVAAYASHTAHYGHVIDKEGRQIDSALVLPMRGKRSYTGEDTVEIHCHGGSLISRRVLEVVLAAGARAALPGEFTFKAFLNGKLDLSQAEAVQELIAAKNEHAVDAAALQLQGALARQITHFQGRLTHSAAILEAWVDFPEEGLEFTTLPEILEHLEAIRDEMSGLYGTYREGKILHEGLSLCLIGAPNVGKSSLMNALLDKEKAIVSPLPGTTRDLVEDHLRINGLNIKLTDTAGIRHADEWIEQEGIRRSKEALTQADLILFVLDVTRGIEEEEQQILQQLPPAKTIGVWNKKDLPHAPLPLLQLPHLVEVSAQTRAGLEELRKRIDAVIWEAGPPSREELILTNVRHHQQLGQAIQALDRLIEGLKNGVSPEFLSFDMRCCLTELGKIIGTDVTEDVLSSIFSTFCIGK